MKFIAVVKEEIVGSSRILKELEIAVKEFLDHYPEAQ